MDISISDGRCPSLIDYAPSGLSHYSPERAGYANDGACPIVRECHGACPIVRECHGACPIVRDMPWGMAHRNGNHPVIALKGRNTMDGSMLLTASILFQTNNTLPYFNSLLIFTDNINVVRNVTNVATSQYWGRVATNVLYNA